MYRIEVVNQKEKMQTSTTQVFVKDYAAEGVDLYRKILLDLGQDPYKEHSLSVVVEGGFESPYQFLNHLRRALLSDGLQPIYLTRGIYWSVDESGFASFCKSAITSSCDGVSEIPLGAGLFDA